MSAATVVVVQSGDLAAWVGAVSGLAGVVLGAGIDSLRRKRAERERKRHDLIRAGTRLAQAASAYKRASTVAGNEPADPLWRQILDGHLEQMENASSTISQAGDEEVTRASLAIVTTAFSSHEPSTPEEATMTITSQAGAMSAYRDAVSKAKL